jgi:predicted nucleic acid-binding protein
MLICIDSSALILGLEGTDPDAVRILDLVSHQITLVIPRLIAQEVTRNLTTSEQAKQFYQLFRDYDVARIIDEPVSPTLVEKYASLGLPAKADAFIGAFAEWMNVSYLISENRHFLRQLQNPAFEVLDAEAFIRKLSAI